MNAFKPFNYDESEFIDQINRSIDGLEIPGSNRDTAAMDRFWASWHAHLAKREEPTWHFDSRTFGEAMKKHWTGVVDVWVVDAVQMVEGEGLHGDITIPYVAGKGIDWNANPTGSMSWGGMHYFTFLRWPVRAAMITGESRFVRMVSECISSYIRQVDHIRDESGVMGRGPEEGGLRTVWNTLSIGMKLKALGEALYALRDHPDWTVEDCKNTSILLWRFASYLNKQLQGQTAIEWQQQLNFISSGSGGLGGVGALLPEWTVSAEWLETAKQVQEVLLLNQVHPDGFQKEICTQYHKTVIRSFATLQMILARRGLPSFYDTEPYRTRFLAMHHFLADLVMPDGFTPAINSAVYARDWTAFLAASNAFFKDPVLQWYLDRGYDPHAIPIQKGGAGWGNTILNDLSIPTATTETKEPDGSSKLYPDSGIAILRDGLGEDANALVLDFGHPDGGHAYAGQASFSAWVKGAPAVISPGSPFAYSDPEYRPWYYSTQGQNTIWIDDDDQEIWRPGNKRRIWGRLLDWQDSDEETRIRITHDGYYRSKGILHERTVILRKGRYFLIYDLVDGTGSDESHSLKWTVRCPDELREDSGQIVSDGTPGMRVIPGCNETIRETEIGWGPSMVPVHYQPDMSIQKRNVCHVRFLQDLKAGEVARYVVLITAGDCTDASIECESTDGRLNAKVTAYGETDVLVVT
jgi:hypothetical protein